MGLEEYVDVPELPGAHDLRATVAYVQTPVTATPKSTCQVILEDHRTRVLILDDITRLRMHRKDDQDTLDLIRALMSMRVTLVLIGVGIPDSGLLSEGWQDPETGQWEFPEPGREDFKDEASTQTARRFDLVDLRPFSYDTADDIADFVDHFAGLEDELRLFNAREGMLTGGDMPEYIYRRTGGVVGLIERLIEDGASLAMDTGIEEITEELLDRAIIRTQHPKRDRAAGEEGEVPPALRAKKAVQVRRPRNIVFDDKGVPPYRRKEVSRPCPRCVLSREAFRRRLTSPFPGSSSGWTPRQSSCLSRTGLADRPDQAALPVPHLIGLPVEQRQHFATMIKATDAEVTAMLLDNHGSRFPPAQPSATGRNGANQHHRWLFLHSTRYCPQCLARQATPVERAFGGAWKISWRLPPTFACLEHGRFLEHVCPACKPLVLHTATRHGGKRLPRWREDSLHPSQCRAFVDGPCGHRLDENSALAHKLPPECRKLQKHLLEILDPHGPPAIRSIGHETSPSHYFNDLRSACHLLRTVSCYCPEGCGS